VALKRSDLGLGVLIVVNIAFLVWVGRIWIDSFAGGAGTGFAGAGPDTLEGIGGAQAVIERSLTVHLPLAGTPAAATVEGDACERLEGFLLDASHHLSKTETDAPMTNAGIKALVSTKRCSLEEPAVSQAIERYRVVWVAAGLPAIGPLVAR
jgi:hypothetical protein